jgi:outer membrane protein assembly factor BamB
MAKRLLACLTLTFCVAWLPAAPRGRDRGEFQPKPFDWPQWRGPERSGVSKETGLLRKWPVLGPPLAWKAEQLGNGYGSVSVAAGRVFGMGAIGGAENVWALHETTGKPLWNQTVARPSVRVDRGDGPRSTPTVDGDRLYALGVGGDLVCLDVASGKVLWHKNYRTDFGSRTMPKWGYSESPLVDGDKLICTPGADQAALVALDKKTGEVIWKSHVQGAGSAGYASIVPAEVAGVRLYITWLRSGLVGVAAKDGKLLWRYRRNANRVANIPTPIVHGDLVFCSTGYNAGSALLKLVPVGTGIQAQEQYFLPGKVLQNHHGGMVLEGDYLYGGHGHNKGLPVCVELKTGRITPPWKNHRGPGIGSAAVAYADGRLYFRYQDGVMALLDATPDHYQVESTFRLPDRSDRPSWPHPVIANGRLYVRDQDILLCYDVKKR